MAPSVLAFSSALPRGGDAACRFSRFGRAPSAPPVRRRHQWRGSLRPRLLVGPPRGGGAIWRGSIRLRLPVGPGRVEAAPSRGVDIYRARSAMRAGSASRRCGDSRARASSGNGPQSAAAVRTRAARPARMSWGESPTKSAPSGPAPRRSRAASTGAGCGLCSVTSSNPHEDVEVVIQPAARQPAPRQGVRLARDDGQPDTGSFEGRQAAIDARVRTQQPVMVRVGVGAVGVRHPPRLLVVPRERAELRPEGRPEPRPPPRLVGHRAEMRPHRVAERRHDQPDGIDQGTVEVEEAGGYARARWARRIIARRRSRASRRETT